jgi:hypothetical protein
VGEVRWAVGENILLMQQMVGESFCGRSIEGRILVGPAIQGTSLGSGGRFDGSSQWIPIFRIAGPGAGEGTHGTVAQNPLQGRAAAS